jgi:hypothetical protein
MTMSDAPVLPAAARMICSSWGRFMAKMFFDFPNLLRCQYTGKGRILAQTSGFLGVGFQEIKNFFQGTRQNLSPFSVTAQQTGSIGVTAGPAIQIVAGNLEPIPVAGSAARPRSGPSRD